MNISDIIAIFALLFSIGACYATLIQAKYSKNQIFLELGDSGKDYHNFFVYDNRIYSIFGIGAKIVQIERFHEGDFTVFRYSIHCINCGKYIYCSYDLLNDGFTKIKGYESYKDNLEKPSFSDINGTFSSGIEALKDCLLKFKLYL